MPKRKPKSGSTGALVTLVVVGLLAFAGGEAYLLLTSDSGHLKLARYLGVGDPARVTLIIGRQVRRGLAALEVPPDSVHVLGPAQSRRTGRGTGEASPGRAAMRWRVGLTPDQSPLKVNYAITHFVEQAGGMVLSGRETTGRGGEVVVTIVVGLPERPTHEIALVRAPEQEGPGGKAPGRIALVLYGFADDPRQVEAASALPAPFAVALAPGAPASKDLFRSAHRQGREIVLHLPLEPINSPQVSPGPGAVLVTMKPAEITGLTRRYLDQAEPVAAVANDMGSLATQDMTVMTAVYRELKRRHLAFIHLSPVAGAVCRPLAAQLGVMYDEPDAVLDAEAREPDERALDRRWGEVLAEARDHDRMIVWLRATPRACGWLPGAAAAKRLQGVDLVPLSSLLARPSEL